MKFKSKYIPYILILILGFLLMLKFQEEPKVVTKTEIEYVERTDTITRTKIELVPDIRYIRKVETVRGKDSIIYVQKEDSTTIRANEYDTKLESNNAVADLKILTTGELLDVSGSISYDEKVTHTTTTITKAKSGGFVYLEAPIISAKQHIKVGVDYQIRNKMIIGVGAYAPLDNTNNFGITVKLGFRIF
jgi:hypothetical protein